jgi:hypothetical protein
LVLTHWSEGPPTSDPMKAAGCLPFAKTLKSLPFLFVGPWVFALLVVINAVISPGHWWVKWPALGLGIAGVISLFRGLRLLVVVGGIRALIALLRRRNGEPVTSRVSSEWASEFWFSRISSFSSCTVFPSAADSTAAVSTETTGFRAVILPASPVLIAF